MCCEKYCINFSKKRVFKSEASGQCKLKSSGHIFWTKAGSFQFEEFFSNLKRTCVFESSRAFRPSVPKILYKETRHVIQSLVAIRS